MHCWSRILNMSLKISSSHPLYSMAVRALYIFLILHTLSIWSHECVTISSSSHGSPIIFIEFPEPSFHLIPAEITCFASHATPNKTGNISNLIELPEIYNPGSIAPYIYTLLTRLFGLVMNRHPCFPSIAMLKSLKLIPHMICIDLTGPNSSNEYSPRRVLSKSWDASFKVLLISKGRRKTLIA